MVEVLIMIKKTSRYRKYLVEHHEHPSGDATVQFYLTYTPAGVRLCNTLTMRDAKWRVDNDILNREKIRRSK